MNQMMTAIVFIIFTAISMAAPAFAEEHQPMSGHHGMMDRGGMAHGAMEKENKGNHFSPPWAQALSDEQKLAIDRMHLTLESELVILKAQAELAQKELNAYTIRDDAKATTTSTMIDKLLAVNKKILERRYAHLREMRKTLTAEQRISYDMGVLKRSGAK